MGRKLERGQVLPLMAILIAVLLGFAGFAVDVGYLRYEQRLQQTATDSAALAGAGEKIYGTNITTAARTAASNNGFANGTNGVQVAVVNPPDSGRYTSDSDAVQVTISAPNPTFFMKIFGFGSANIVTRAVATASNATTLDCVIQLNPSGNANFNNETFDGPNCGIAINSSSANMHGATINAGAISYAGSAPNENGATFSKATPAPSLPAVDPCLQISGCAYLKNNPPSTTPCNSTYAGNGFMSPGCYGSVDLGKGTVLFNPGLYIINGAFNGNQATMTQAAGSGGVTFYITSTGSMNLNKTTIDLSAPTTGNTAGMLFYSTNTSAPNFNKTGSNFSGVVYLPNADVNFNTSLNNYVILILGGANFNSSSAMDFNGPTSSGSFIKEPILVE
jgi:Flp pilus assembly protein TadG